jgi:hypothetical protein
MTPDERQLLSGLFDRIRGQANQPRDREAESFIADAVRAQPYAPYLLAQTVIVQEQALRAASERLQQLEAQVAQGGPHEETSFLGNLGKSIFGSAQPAPRQSVPPTGGYAPGPQDAYGQRQGGPWGQPQQQGYAPQAYPPQQYAPQQGGGFAAAPQGGGFLKGALGAAAGVAGGVLLADSMRGLFGGHNNPFGIAGGMGAGGGETIVNNYYDSPDQGGGGAEPTSYDDAQQDFLQDQADDFGSDGGDTGGGDDSYNV